MWHDCIFHLFNISMVCLYLVGAKKLSKDVKDMTGTAPFIYLYFDGIVYHFSRSILCLSLLGAKKLSKDVKDMTGTAPFIYFTVCWYVFSPLLILVSK